MRFVFLETICLSFTYSIKQAAKNVTTQETSFAFVHTSLTVIYIFYCSEACQQQIDYC